MDTNPNPKDKVQQLFRLGIYSLDFQDLFLYIVVFKDLNQVLRKALKGFQKGPRISRNNVSNID